MFVCKRESVTVTVRQTVRVFTYSYGGQDKREGNILGEKIQIVSAWTRHCFHKTYIRAMNAIH